MDDSLKRSARIILKILAVLCVAVAIFYIMSSMRVRRVEYVGNVNCSEEELDRQIFTKWTDRFSYLFKARMTLMGTPEIPFVERLDIEIPDSGTIRIYVYERTLVGCVEQMGSYIYFDREGIVTGSYGGRYVNVPEIKGVSFKKLVVGQKLETDKNGLFDDILKITLLLRKNNIDAWAIEFSERYEPSICIDDEIVLLGRSDDYDVSLANLNSILAGLPEGKYKIDMRYYSEEKREVTARRYD